MVLEIFPSPLGKSHFGVSNHFWHSFFFKEQNQRWRTDAEDRLCPFARSVFDLKFVMQLYVRYAYFE